MLQMTRLLLAGSLCSLFVTPLCADRPHPWQLGLQESASTVMDKITSLHNLLLIVTFAIAIIVASLLLFTIHRFRAKRNPISSTTSHNTMLEITWTLIPVIILGIIAVPSFKLLHFADKPKKTELTLKVTGHQWFWEYDYPEYQINFNSYIVSNEKLMQKDLRLLEVDEKVILPIDTNIRILVTAADVIHSWAIPAYGIKQDAIPGRLREIWIRIHKLGPVYGQCSELCGQGHGFMPINVEAVTKEKFQRWLQCHKPKNEVKPSPSQPQQGKQAEQKPTASPPQPGQEAAKEKKN
jgi:cytochrome c oxidase subunit 2